MKKQWEKWEPNYVENEVHSNGSLDFVLSLRLPLLLKLALLRTSRHPSSIFSLCNILLFQCLLLSKSSPLNTFPSQHLLLSNINISLSQYLLPSVSFFLNVLSFSCSFFSMSFLLMFSPLHVPSSQNSISPPLNIFTSLSISSPLNFFYSQCPLLSISPFLNVLSF